MKESGTKDIPGKEKTARAKGGKEAAAKEKFPMDPAAKPVAPAKAKAAPVKNQKTTVAKASSAAGMIEIDYPSENEAIIPGHYAIRVSAPAGGFVDVSVNNEAWFACRFEVGFYWTDWWPAQPGKHTLRARHRDAGGTVSESAARRCDVVGPSVS
jgi:hypothetical protein